MLFYLQNVNDANKSQSSMNVSFLVIIVLLAFNDRVTPDFLTGKEHQLCHKTPNKQGLCCQATHKPISGFKHIQTDYYKWRNLFGMTSAQS